MKIKQNFMIKSVITAAGKGTRLLPITKELPKEMMPIFSKMYGNGRVVMPLLQFIFEQLYTIGIRDYCFVVGREKRSIEDHFTPHESYLKEINDEHKKLITNFYKHLEKSHLMWVNQNKPLGFGDAVRRTEKYVGADDFVVHAGDVAVLGKQHPILRLIKISKNNDDVSAILLFKKIKNPKRFGVPKISKISNLLYRVDEIEEKPSIPKSNFGVLPLYYFKSEVFEYLKKIRRDKNNEFQLTDAIQKMIEDGKKVVGILLEKDEVDIDVGTVESYKLSQEVTYKIA